MIISRFALMTAVLMLTSSLSYSQETQDSEEMNSNSVDPSANEPSGFGLTGSKSKKGNQKPKKQSSQRRKTRKKRNKKEDEGATQAKTAKSGSKIGIGVEAGWESPYGNGATFHMILADFLDLNGGVGYNNSGLKLGGGAHLLLAMSPAFSLRFGASLVRSQGRSGDVSLEAKFTPEGSSNSETIEATKDFEVSEAFMVSPSVGVKLNLGDTIALIAGGNYNVILSGNEVTFKDDVGFNKNIELTNKDDFDDEFDKEAKSLVQAGGLGFHVGLVILL